MVILDPYGMNFDDLGVFGLAFHLLFKSCSTYCAKCMFAIHTHLCKIYMLRGGRYLFMIGDLGCIMIYHIKVARL